MSCTRFCARFATALIYLYIGSLRDLGTVPAQENSSIDNRGVKIARARDNDKDLFWKPKSGGMDY